MCFPPKRFFYFAEDAYAQEEKFVPILDFSNCRVFIKYNAPSVTVFRYLDQWLTSWHYGSNIYSLSLEHRFTTREKAVEYLETMFWEEWKLKKYLIPSSLNINSCFTFVFHPEEHILKLVAGRNLTNFEEYSWKNLIEISQTFQWQVVEQVENVIEKLDFSKEENYLSVCKDLVAYARRLNPVTTEGLVVCCHDFTRVAFKSPHYIALAVDLPQYVYPREKLKYFFNIVRSVMFFQYESLFVKYFPNWKLWFEFVKDLILDFCGEVDELWKKAKNLSSKELASLDAPKDLKSILLNMQKFQFKNMKEYFIDPKVQEDNRFNLLVEPFLYKYISPSHPPVDHD